MLGEERSKNLVLCGSFIKLVIPSFRFSFLPTMYQVFILRNVWKQLVECLVVLHETLKKKKKRERQSKNNQDDMQLLTNV